jgi:hypothetical protein
MLVSLLSIHDLTQNLSQNNRASRPGPIDMPKP